MAIEILTASDVEKMRVIGRIAAATLRTVQAAIRPGMSTLEIDRIVRTDTRERRARPSQLGYHGFPAAVCTSRNDVACHGIPSATEILEDGDLISVDVTSNLDGWHGDNCATFFVGTPSAEARHLVEVTHRCRAAGIEVIRPGVRIGDIGAAIEPLARAEGCSVVTSVGGHGIGRQMHQDPHVSHAGRPGRGLRLRAGQAITVEPILTLGRPELREDADGWTLRTADGTWAAQFEHTVLVTPDGAEILTV